MDREGDNIDLSQVFTDPRAGLVPSAPQRGGFFSRGSSVSVTTIRGADGVIIMSVLINIRLIMKRLRNLTTNKAEKTQTCKTLQIETTGKIHACKTFQIKFKPKYKHAEHFKKRPNNQIYHILTK